ncbi:hypothetical protein B0H13DRAFT_2337877 [Mycena leptocephala]|nr:hypothetical protein B0H13DRAFT_2337877 [Mycena leptocephala]
MNSTQYATAIMDELRGWTHEWLEGLLGIRRHQVTLGLPVPYPSHPLPVGFPFGEFSLSERFEWIHTYGAQQQLRHIHHVEFFFYGRTQGSGSSVAWKVVDSITSTPLGIFEIADPIYKDATLPFRIDTDLVLEAMAASLRKRVPIHLTSHIVPSNVHLRGVPRPLRIYELRTSNHTIIRRRPRPTFSAL